jgi:hypothetical protein
MAIATHLFHWFYGNVWGNLVASGICTAIAYFRLKAMHRKHEHAIHNHITQEFANLRKQEETN